MTMLHKATIGVVAALILGFGIWYFTQGGGGVPTRVFDTSQTLDGNFAIEQGTKAVLKNGATLTVNGDLLVQGAFECDGGPLNLVVNGTFTLERLLQCNRAETLAADDIGNGITVVATSFTITKNAVVASNGQVQMVTKADKLATTKEAVDALYDEAGKYGGEKFHFGPMTTLEEIPDSAKGKPTSFELPSNNAVPAKTFFSVARNIVVPVALAQEPATDIEGNPVAGTTKIGGTWIVGNPAFPPPFNLTIPTPPAGIKKIILNFDFGGDDVEIADFELTGPDGRPGTDDVNANCEAKGGKGENAMRLNVRAATITVNNFDLHLGNGGPGGTAETTKDCDPGTATGGEGGEAGNFKMVASEGFNITGKFTIFPGKGGKGGKAIAHGKKGDDGCDGVKGGDATATGGKGGDNKKLLVVSGTVVGTSNIDIREIVGGEGGEGVANGGNGGNGNGPECNGGPGGNGTATGGKGGDTTCAKFPCTGGKGGDASAKSGTGGKGGVGSATEAGGNGGKGGDATATGGTGGAGKTGNGDDGRPKDKTGGNGGNGGDGCGPGAGGEGGAGDPNGQKGEDGKNLCVLNTNANTNTSTIPTNENTNTATTPQTTFETPGDLSATHNIGPTSCPQKIGTVEVKGQNIPDGAYVVLDPDDEKPKWMDVTLGGGGLSQDVKFTCNIDELKTQTLTHNLKVQVRDKDGKVLKEFTKKVTMNVKK